MSFTTDRNNVVNTDTQANQAGILKNALKMAFGTMTSRALGLLRESLLAALFDKSVTDAWAAAFRLPNMFRRLLGEGSLSVSFIPVFVEAHHESEERARNLVNSLYTVLLMLLTVITTIGVLFPEMFLNVVLDAQYIAQVQKYEMTRAMAQIMFGFVFCISSFAFFMGILNALGQFFWPAIAPTFWNLAMVISTLWPQSWISEKARLQGHQLAWGVLIGGAVQALVLIPALKRLGFLPKISFKWLNKDLFRVFKNMGPGLIGMGLLQFTTIVNLKFASSLAEGTISYINYVDRLIELPLSLISVSLGTALLPVLSKLWVENKKNEMSEQARHYLELNLFVSISAAFGLYVLAEPIIDLLFGRGRFQAQDVQNAALILKTYCWIMVFSSGVRVLTPAYYAIKNTWFPAIISAVSLVIHIFLAPTLMAHYQVRGLMLSTITSAAVNLTLLLAFYSYFMKFFNYKNFFKRVFLFTGQGVLIALIASLYFFLQNLFSRFLLPIFFSEVLSLLLVMALVGLTIFGAGLKLFPKEFQRIYNQLSTRFSKK